MVQPEEGIRAQVPYCLPPRHHELELLLPRTSTKSATPAKSLEVTLDASKWPEVPKANRPKKLPVNTNVSAEVREAFFALGWAVIDVRLLPQAERFDAVVEGIMLGTIAPTADLLAGLDLELKLRGKDGGGGKDDGLTGRETIDQLFGKKAKLADNPLLERD